MKFASVNNFVVHSEVSKVQAQLRRRSLPRSANTGSQIDATADLLSGQNVHGALCWYQVT